MLYYYLAIHIWVFRARKEDLELNVIENFLDLVNSNQFNLVIWRGSFDEKLTLIQVQQ